MTNSLVRPDHIYSVSQLTEVIKTALEVAFPVVWVEGEISNFKRHSSGHLYFTLKDEKSALKVVMWRSDARAIAFEVKDGLKITCRGRISVYDVRGEYQLYADMIEPKGKGALQLAFEQLKEKLRAEGLFEPQHKKVLPLRPQKIGIVTSATGAALRDILRVLERRYAKVKILIYPARVQGEGAAKEIVEGIDTLGRFPDVDVIIVGRAAAPSRTSGPSTRSPWPGRFTARLNRSSRPSVTRSTSRLPILWPMSGRRRPRRPRRW